MALGAMSLLPLLTITLTVSAVLVWDPSLTTREKVSVVADEGAVNVGFTAVEDDRLTLGPAVCVH